MVAMGNLALLAHDASHFYQENNPRLPLFKVLINLRTISHVKDGSSP